MSGKGLPCEINAANKDRSHTYRALSTVGVTLLVGHGIDEHFVRAPNLCDRAKDGAYQLEALAVIRGGYRWSRIGDRSRHVSRPDTDEITDSYIRGAIGGNDLISLIRNSVGVIQATNASGWLARVNSSIRSVVDLDVSHCFSFRLSPVLQPAIRLADGHIVPDWVRNAREK
jgi:hypothetical protein